jgi:preprotein translocase subunit SecA
MRLFGSERIAAVMDRIGIQEGEVIQHPMITKSVERAQKKVEEQNFSIRKRLLEYDNVMNQQREVIYTRRHHALEGDRLKAEILDNLRDYIADEVEKYYDEAKIEELREEIMQNLLVNCVISAEEWEPLGKEGVVDKFYQEAKSFYNKKEETMGSDLMARLERYAVLSVIDEKWKDHLRDMDDLKEGIGLRAYGQKDPLLEYKGEAFRMFETLLSDIRDNVVFFCFKFWPQAPEEIQERRPQPRQRINTEKQSVDGLGYSRSSEEPRPEAKQKPIHADDKVGRNDPCPCGSGKKFKNCHGQS